MVISMKARKVMSIYDETHSNDVLVTIQENNVVQYTQYRFLSSNQNMAELIKLISDYMKEGVTALEDTYFAGTVE